MVGFVDLKVLSVDVLRRTIWGDKSQEAREWVEELEGEKYVGKQRIVEAVMKEKTPHTL